MILVHFQILQLTLRLTTENDERTKKKLTFGPLHNKFLRQNVVQSIGINLW